MYTKSNAVWEVVWVDREGNWTSVDPDNPLQGIRYVALSPDNKKLAVSNLQVPGSDSGNVWIKQLPRGPFAQLTFEGEVNMRPSWSPDDQSVLFISDRGENRGGSANVYVRPFPEADTETLVSVNGGVEPVWSRTRPELYYRNGSGEMVVVPVLPGPEFATGPQEVLFSANEYRRDFFHATYDVTADGQRFVMILASRSGTLEEELIVVENWFEELNHVAPSN